MRIDVFTILLCDVLIRTVLAILFLAFWLKDTRATWFGWASATIFFSDLAAIFFLTNGIAPTFDSIGIGTAALLATFACAWQGARAFEGRKPMWFATFAVPGSWLAFSLIPSFLQNTPVRVVVASLLLTPLLAMTSVEYWRGRHEALPSRWPIIVLFASLAAVFAVRVLLVGMLPFPFGALPMQSTWVAGFTTIMSLHTVAIAILFVALTRERLEREQHQHAQTDLLTGALNRRAFLQYGERLMTRHRMSEKPLSLMMLDIDRFKPLNDQLGHVGGDRTLIRFVALVRDNIRPGDLLFRLGGDEFCCLLPETSAGQACLVAERVRDRFEAAAVDVGGAPIKLTASMGIASTETCGYSLDVLMHEADRAVYAAKRRGRNCVVLATDFGTGTSEQPVAGG
jgi:diguanylate cyclase (GGDEF)-like protein